MRLATLARSVFRSRWFAIAVVLNYAVGIGLALAVFAVVDRVLFRELPFGGSSRLVAIQPYDARTRQVFFTLPKVLVVELRKVAAVFDDIGFAGNTRSYFLDGPDAPPMSLTDASYNLLDVLAVRPIAGRTYSRLDALAKSRLILIREETWRARYGSDAAIIGRVLRDRQGQAQIIGVVPLGFVIPTVNWATRSDGLILSPELLESAQPGQGVPAAVARLSAGVSVDQARQTVAHIAAAVEPDTLRRSNAIIRPLRQGLFWNSLVPMAVVTGGAVVVWLGVVANLAMLASAHVWARRRQLAVRAALGESRGMLFRSLIVENLIVCSLGTAAALLVLYWLLGTFAANVPGFIQPLILSNLDARMVGLAVSACLVATLVIVLVESRVLRQAPALADLQETRSVGLLSRRVGGSALIVVQGAIAMGLLVSGISTVSSLMALTSTPVGFDPIKLYALGFGQTKASSVNDFDEVLQRLKRLPGVAAVSAIDTPIAQGETPEMVRSTVLTDRRFARRRVLPDYFDVMRIRIVAGRPFSEQERADNAAVAVVTVAAAKELWPTAQPLDVVGRSVRFEGDSERLIVGVIADQRERQGVPALPEIYLAAPAASAGLRVVLRSRNEIDASAVRQAIRSVYGPGARVSIGAVSAAIEPWLANPTLYALVFGCFGAVGVLVAVLGVGSLTSYEVRRRRPEIAVRTAIGCTSRQIVWLFLRDAGIPLAMGILIGGSLAWSLASYLQPLLHGVRAREPITFVLAGFTLLASSATLIVALAKRTSSIDPSVLLRHR